MFGGTVSHRLQNGAYPNSGISLRCTVLSIRARAANTGTRGAFTVFPTFEPTQLGELLENEKRKSAERHVGHASLDVDQTCSVAASGTDNP